MILILLLPAMLCAEQRPLRDVLMDLALEDYEDPEGLLNELGSHGDPFIKEFVESWRTGEVLLLERGPDQPPLVLHRYAEEYHDLESDAVVSLTQAEEESLSKARPSRKLRRELVKIIDTIDLANPNEQVRIDAARKLGLSRNEEYIPVLQRRLGAEESARARRALEEAIIINQLDRTEATEDIMEAVVRLGDLKSVAGRDLVEDYLEAAEESGNEELAAASRRALRRIDEHMAWVEQLGNLFRGMSLGSVLLMVSFGLAITFGLMGIINMAHGEFIAIGGYTCYLVQNAFAAAFGPQSAAYQWFFIVSLPVSFVVAALIGIGFEKSFIRFLYRRPLESLLATWGLSMVMQQVYRLVFGAANVQVNTPGLLVGNFELWGASLSYTRIFVIGFAILTVIATWLLLTRTNLGLYIRAVMQNRHMAASLGIPVSRVNTLTFAFGCGLASLAGVVLSQLGNVGPSMGQAYIVDSFMVVVAGSVGNLLGAGVSAMGIGLVDQFLQPAMGPVMGKITVFAVIILFLQWKPGGLFPTKSRSLED